jgi:ribosomal protein RSM22 (predicted rRNA methylase)
MIEFANFEKKINTAMKKKNTAKKKRKVTNAKKKMNTYKKMIKFSYDDTVKFCNGGILDCLSQIWYCK